MAVTSVPIGIIENPTKKPTRLGALKQFYVITANRVVRMLFMTKKKTSAIVTLVLDLQ